MQIGTHPHIVHRSGGMGTRNYTRQFRKRNFVIWEVCLRLRWYIEGDASKLARPGSVVLLLRLRSPQDRQTTHFSVAVDSCASTLADGVYMTPHARTQPAHVALSTFIVGAVYYCVYPSYASSLQQSQLAQTTTAQVNREAPKSSINAYHRFVLRPDMRAEKVH